MNSAAHQHRRTLWRAAPGERAEPASHYSLPYVEELTPVPEPEELVQHLVGLPHLLFLDSALRHSTLGRYSFLTADPFEWLWSRGRSRP